MIIGLSGDMGTGKTTFVRAICDALQSPDWVNSPTYAIMQHYTSKSFDILHIDLYRLNHDIEIDQLDIESLITNNTIAFIEWIDKTNLIVPDVQIHFSMTGDTKRDVSITSKDAWVQSIK